MGLVHLNRLRMTCPWWREPNAFFGVVIDNDLMIFEARVARELFEPARPIIQNGDFQAATCITRLNPLTAHAYLPTRIFSSRQ